MAGVKVTDLTPLGAAASDDVFYIVDTSANQSKKIEVQNIFDGMPQLASGTAALSVSNVTNSAVISLDYDCIYSRVGNVVTMTMPIVLVMDAGNNSTQFNLSLPIASDFTGQKQAYGVFFGSIEHSNLAGALIQSDDTNDAIFCQVESISNGAVFNYLTLSIQYLIL